MFHPELATVCLSEIVKLIESLEKKENYIPGHRVNIATNFLNV